MGPDRFYSFFVWYSEKRQNIDDINNYFKVSQGFNCSCLYSLVAKYVCKTTKQGVSCKFSSHYMISCSTMRYCVAQQVCVTCPVIFSWWLSGDLRYRHVDLSFMILVATLQKTTISHQMGEGKSTPKWQTVRYM